MSSGYVLAPGGGFFEIMAEEAAQAQADCGLDCGLDCSLLAIHEAGHAVIGLDLGFRILNVSIAGNAAAGTADFAPLRPRMLHDKPSTKALRKLEAYGQVCLAGPTAELWSDPNAFNLEDYAWPDRGADAEGWAQDVTEVMRFAAKLGTPEWFREIARKTRARVEQQWRAIETVADALLRQGTLTEDELLAVLGRTVAQRRRCAPSPRLRGEGWGHRR